jgi:hypothetical protein
VNFTGAASHAGKLTAGLLGVGRTFTAGTAFAASGSHTLAFTGTSGTQDIAFPNATSFSAQNLTIAGGAKVRVTMPQCAAHAVTVRGDLAVTGAGGIQDATFSCGGSATWTVKGALRTSAASAVSTSASVTETIVLEQPSGTQFVEGSFSPAITVFSGAGAYVRPGLGYRDITFAGTGAIANVKSLGGITASGHLMVAAGTVFGVNGNTLTAAGTLGFGTGASLLMQNAADTLALGSHVDFTGAADLTGKLTAGALMVGGAVRAGAGALQPSGTHTVVLTGGSGAQDLHFNGSSTAFTFQNLEIAGGAKARVSMSQCAAHAVTVRGDLAVTGAGGIQDATFSCGGSATWTVKGALRTSAASAVSTSASVTETIVLEQPSGTAQVSGTFSPWLAVFAAANPTVRPSVGYRSIRFTGSGSLANVKAQGAIAVSGDVTLAPGASLDVNGNRVDASGTLTVGTGATLVMDAAADTVATLDATFTGAADHTGKLTAGALMVARHLTVGTTFAPSGAHAVVFTGASGAQDIVVGGGATAITFQNLTVAGGARARLSLPSCSPYRVTIQGALAVTGAGGIDNAVWSCGPQSIDWVVKGPLSSAAASSITTTGSVVESLTLEHATGTANVVGAFSPYLTQFAGTGQTMKAGLGYRAVTVTGSATLGTGATTLTGLLTNSGTLTVPAGASLNANGGLTLNAGSTLVNNGDIKYPVGTYTKAAGATVTGNNPHP